MAAEVAQHRSCRRYMLRLPTCLPAAAQPGGGVVGQRPGEPQTLRACACACAVLPRAGCAELLLCVVPRRHRKHPHTLRRPHLQGTATSLLYCTIALVLGEHSLGRDNSTGLQGPATLAPLASLPLGFHSRYQAQPCGSGGRQHCSAARAQAACCALPPCLATQQRTPASTCCRLHLRRRQPGQRGRHQRPVPRQQGLWSAQRAGQCRLCM